MDARVPHPSRQFVKGGGRIVRWRNDRREVFRPPLIRRRNPDARRLDQTPLYSGMRIIAGCWKGRTLDVPRGRDTRPILDRVKVSLFDRLGARLAAPGQLPPVAVLDLFSGGGSLGLECLSRGAAFCCFVERDRRALVTLRANLDRLGIIEEARTLPADALTVCPPEPPGDRGYELVFLDPPYAMSRDVGPQAPIPRLCHRLARLPAVDPSALLILRHESRVRFDAIETPELQLDDRLNFGKMAITVLRLEREALPEEPRAAMKIPSD